MAELYQCASKYRAHLWAAIIPALDPDEALVALVGELREAGFTDILIVDDGSGAAAQSVFRQVMNEQGISVLRHSVNAGKGAALRTGFRHFLNYFPAHAGAVTVDSDGQHTALAALHVARAGEENPDSLVIGARSFDRNGKTNVPFRSWFGNNISRLVFRLFLDRPLHDTQSGLRAIPKAAIPALLELSGDRYEYETNMLVWARRAGIPIHEVPIETVYLAGNQSSHFRPLTDSMRIYLVLLRFFSSSLAAAAVDITLFALLWHFSDRFGWSFAVARFASSMVNFALNRDYVFRSRAAIGTAVLRYYGLVAAIGIASYAASSALVSVGFPVLAAKLTADAVSAILSFMVQRGFVFPRPVRPLPER
ncbi:MAG: bifunctional glycosyltransferase family 2/GtrA family protein [Bryobacterales bacterium]|nr:bifunctional glycosyltransferase family 2/GtrA family protein [Bryobacterales bacterium]